MVVGSERDRHGSIPHCITIELLEELEDPNRIFHRCHHHCQNSIYSNSLPFPSNSSKFCLSFIPYYQSLKNEYSWSTMVNIQTHRTLLLTPVAIVSLSSGKLAGRSRFSTDFCAFPNWAASDASVSHMSCKEIPKELLCKWHYNLTGCRVKYIKFTNPAVLILDAAASICSAYSFAFCSEMLQDKRMTKMRCAKQMFG